MSISGEVDAHNSAELDDALRAAARRSPYLVIDLTGVTFIDSSGLGALIGARNRADVTHESMCLVHPPTPVRRILRGTHLESAFTIFDDLNEALGHVSRSRIPH